MASRLEAIADLEVLPSLRSRRLAPCPSTSGTSEVTSETKLVAPRGPNASFAQAPAQRVHRLMGSNGSVLSSSPKGAVCWRDTT